MYRLAVVVMLVGSAAYADTTVSFGTPTVRGALDAKVLEDNVKGSSAMKSALLACHAKGTVKAASIKVTTTLTIEPNGKLSMSATGSGNADFDNCVASAYSSLSFDKPKDGKQAVAVVPVTFTTTPATAQVTGTGEMSSGFDDVKPGQPIGTISGGGTGSGYGLGRGGMRGRTQDVPQVTIGDPKTKGDLDKAIIRRYIKRNIAKLRYCYEKELLAKPKIKGTLKASFTIGVDGKVTSSTATGIKDAEVERCYAAVIQAIEFPKPKQGEVTVVYPFTLKAK